MEFGRDDLAADALLVAGETVGATLPRATFHALEVAVGIHVELLGLPAQQRVVVRG